MMKHLSRAPATCAAMLMVVAVGHAAPPGGAPRTAVSVPARPAAALPGIAGGAAPGSLPVTLNLKVDLSELSPYVNSAALDCYAIAIASSDLQTKFGTYMDGLGAAMRMAAQYQPTPGAPFDKNWDAQWDKTRIQLSQASGFSVDVPVYYRSTNLFPLSVSNRGFHGTVAIPFQLVQAELISPRTGMLMKDMQVVTACRLMLNGSPAEYVQGIQLAVPSTARYVDPRSSQIGFIASERPLVQ